jgi:DNA polymerase-4
VKTKARPRRILHVDLDPFFVSVERSLDPALRGRPVIVGGDAASDGIVAAASEEAREFGVRPGQTLLAARRLCPQGIFRPGDLESYARVSEEVTAILFSLSRRVERPSSDEAYVDLTPESPRAPQPVPAAEHIKDEIQRRLQLDASLGLASSRLAARVASRGARPRGLLVVLPGYESRFLERQPISCLPELPPHLESALQRDGIQTLGQVLAASDEALAAAAGPAAAARLREAALGEAEEAVAVSAPPTWIQEEAVIRSRRSDQESLLEVLDGLAARAARRLRPFDLRAGTVSVEVVRGPSGLRRSEELQPAVADEETLRQVTRALALPLLGPATAVSALQVRLARLAGPSRQSALFPASGHVAPTSSRL